MTTKEIEQQIVDEFTDIQNWIDRYEYIIELGRELPLINADQKIDNNLITGCQSRVWLYAEMKDGKVIFTADSDTELTKGIVALLIRVLSNQTPDSIIDSELSFIDEIGLKENLVLTRSNGLISMIKQMKLYAVVFKSKM